VRPDEETSADETLDLTGLNCPVPILKTKVALNRLQRGQILRVLATDPLAVVDFRAFCARGRHELVQLSEQAGVYSFWIRKIGG
jgi:tRNA 2-thiouridine synthesizing protein A